jgi:hypothetical protein
MAGRGPGRRGGTHETVIPTLEARLQRLERVDGDGRTRRAALTVGPDRTPGLALADKSGRVVWTAP